MSRTTETLAGAASPTVAGNHFLADLYTFDWSTAGLRLPLVSTLAVALCLVTGLADGHPGAALVAGGGALTIGFGANQRIGDSRILPMLLAVLAMASATLIGTLVGHRSYAILLASGVSAAIYGVLTIRNTGLAWVGQQASVALFVASAFPSSPRPALVRAGLIALGGVVQIVVTSIGLKLMPELRNDLLQIPLAVYHTFYEQRRELLDRLHRLPEALPAPDRGAALAYALRLTVTVVLASMLYLHLGMQSGYWIPMTALLVQKPAFFETLNRGLLRVAGTLAGATLSTVLIARVPLSPWVLAGVATLFAFCCFCTIGVNYGLYSLCMTSYIVFLLSLNLVPGPEIAHRRALATVAGAGIALVLHLDALRRHRETASVA